MAVSETVDAAIPDTVLTTCNIEDIQAGDLVLARDEHGQEIGLKPVKEVYKRTSFHLRHLTFESADSDQQTLSTTDEHPFWSVTADEFLEAGSLPVGHKVTDPHGKTQTLVSSTREEFPNGIHVFNFQVQDFHTYYVAAHAGDDVLLVHNADCFVSDLIPDPRHYDSGASHVDHRLARAFDGIDEDLNKRLVAAGLNLRKGGLEGALKKDFQRMIDGGVDPDDAFEVILPELRALGRDALPTPFSKLPGLKLPTE